MQKTIIFDFDGTLVDSFSVLIELYNEIAPYFNAKTVQSKDMLYFQSIPLKTVLKELNVSHWKLPIIAFWVKRKFRNRIQSIKMINGMKEVIFTLKENGFNIGIVTSNSEKNIRAFLDLEHMANQFDFIYSAKKFYGKSETLKQVIKKHHLTKQKVWYIGDETKDIEACKKINIPIISVSWGAYPSSVLKTYNPNYIADLPINILSFLQVEKKIVS